jgi:hypothetical protein
MAKTELTEVDRLYPVFILALADGAGFSRCGTGFSRSSFSCHLFLRRFQASFQWFFFFLLFHASTMSGLSVDVVDAHDAVVSEGHPVSPGSPGDGGKTNDQSIGAAGEGYIITKGRI